MILKETKRLLTVFEGFHRTPKEVLAECIKYTLDKSLEHYNLTLQRAQEYLVSRDPVKVLKNIEREKRKEEELEEYEEERYD